MTPEEARKGELAVKWEAIKAEVEDCDSQELSQIIFGLLEINNKKLEAYQRAFTDEYGEPPREEIDMEQYKDAPIVPRTLTATGAVPEP